MRTRKKSNSMWAVLVALFVPGCHIAPREVKTQPGGKAPTDIILTQNQIRIRMRALVGPMCGEVEEAADRIAAGTTDRAIQQAALGWKIEAVPAIRAALFQPDPLTAMVDSWALCNQMANYFETGPGKTALGDSSPIAVDTCRRLEEMMAQVTATITDSGDVSKTRDHVRQWAAEHPIKHSIAGRESTLSRVLDRDARGAVSAGEAVADITTSVDDLSRRLEVYAEQLVRQSRWEADLLWSRILTDVPLDKTLPLAERAVSTADQAAATLERLVQVLERAVVLAEIAPEVMASERAAAILALQAELTRMIRFLQEERVAALAHISQERIAALAHMTEERIVGLKSLEEEIETGRKKFTEDLERIGVQFVDRAIWRIAVLFGVVLVVFFTGLVLLLPLTRRLLPAVKHPKE